MPIEIREYREANGNSPFSQWINKLDSHAAARINTYIRRLEQGNFSNLKAVGGGVQELKIAFGPGYRVYLGREGRALIILLGGGSKKRQDQDIRIARDRWQDYLRRRRERT